MQKPESSLENKTHKVHWDIEIESDNLISTRRLDEEIINKKEKKNLLELYRRKVQIIESNSGQFGSNTE